MKIEGVKVHSEKEKETIWGIVFFLLYIGLLTLSYAA
jgi:hypothetical protein